MKEKKMRKRMYAALCSVAVVCTVAYGSSSVETWDVRRFGAVGDGNAMDTAAIQRAVDACAAAGGGRVLLPKGVYLTGSILLKSKVNLHLGADAVLRGSRQLADYEVEIPGPYPEDRVTNKWSNAMIRIVCANDVSITGEKGSVIDGRNCYDPAGEERFRGPHAISVYWTTNLVLNGYQIRDAGNYGHYIRSSANISASRITVAGGHDGFDFFKCDRAEVVDCDIHSGDDCIAGHSSRNLTVKRCRMSTSCSYFRIGGNDILIEDCEGSAPGRYPWRHSLSLEEKRDGITPETSGRRNTISCFTFFTGRLTPCVSTGIVFRNCRFSGMDEVLHYNLSGNERWQCGPGLGDVTFERVSFDGVKHPLCAYGEKGTPLNITFRDSRIGFREPVDVFMRGAEPGRFVIDGLEVSGVKGAFYRSWGGEPVFEVRGLVGVKPVTVKATEKFVQKGI